MKEITKTTYLFEDDDIKFLKTHILPTKPCNLCSSRTRMECCGCNSERDYVNEIKKFNDRGLYKVALQLKEMNTLASDLSSLSERYKQKVHELNTMLDDENIPKEIKDLFLENHSYFIL